MKYKTLVALATKESIILLIWIAQTLGVLGLMAVVMAFIIQSVQPITYEREASDILSYGITFLVGAISAFAIAATLLFTSLRLTGKEVDN